MSYSSYETAFIPAASVLSTKRVRGFYVKRVESRQTIIDSRLRVELEELDSLVSLMRCRARQVQNKSSNKGQNRPDCL